MAATLRHLESRAFGLIVSRCKCVVDRIIKDTDAIFLEIGAKNGRHKPAKTAGCRVIILKATGPLQALTDILDRKLVSTGASDWRAISPRDLADLAEQPLC
ncbi:hypothetical protein [Rhizobium leguminosarum]|uniref:hypothetical protein n=1 Tax=Rhizobium leguminosarum TaxID=384 RepID=UPI00103F273E|nr:hypothetical protein [Rhizobium leguminosarum]TBZ26565.1 hypothetical protein E0H38_01755 [Rhizobium leguminosarum bv. viciae]